MTKMTTEEAFIKVLQMHGIEHSFGIIGSAWATLLSYFVADYLCLLIWPKTRESFYLISKALLFLK